MTDRLRCDWASTNPLLAAYHDEEWGVPVHDDRQWFEKLILDGAQAGLSWLTILKRRDGYRAAFFDFDVKKVARLTELDVERLMQDTGIIRNRSKVESAASNARAFLEIQREFGSFDAYVWQAVGGRPVQNARRGGDWPARTELSDALSKDLKKRGFSFVGSTIVYAFMQATGLVNDHRVDCLRYQPVTRLGRITSGIQPRASKSGRVAGPAPAKKAPVKKAPVKKAPVKKAPAPKPASRRPATTRAPAKKAARRGR